MSDRIKRIIALSLLPQVFLVYLASKNPEFIERYYSLGLYPIVSGLYRSFLGWIPFSIGDIIYVLLGILVIVYLLKNRKRLFTKKMVVNAIMVLSVAYFTFNFMWGLNYYRLPIGDAFDLEEAFTQEELIQVIEGLTRTCNDLQEEITGDTASAVWVPHSRKAIFGTAREGYETLGQRYPKLNYIPPSIKPSLLSTLLSYMGYGGYLNPFTLEGQVNAKLPTFRLPVVSAHEMAHQVGYSAENEANFLGYLAASNSSDPYAQYSAKTFGLSHCLGQLQVLDSVITDSLIARMNPGVRKNFIEVREFWESYKNPLEPVFKSAFDTFLKANRQEEGMASYSRVVGLLVAYHREEPIIN